MAERAGARGRAPLLLKPDLPGAQGEERNRRGGLAEKQDRPDQTGRDRSSQANLRANR